MTAADHARHCFVAIPSGRPGAEREFFEGWKNEVILPAIRALEDFEAHVAAATETPTSITVDIFEHLLFDPVAVFDLGGLTPDAPANPNVMYELGIRHAFRLPSVILAWEHQALPFDINDQRAVKVDRKPVRFGEARQKIEKFVASAAKGQFYDPMESFANRAVLERAGKSDDALQAIGNELANLTSKVEGLRQSMPSASMRVQDSPFVEALRDALPSGPLVTKKTDLQLWAGFLKTLGEMSIKKPDREGED